MVLKHLKVQTYCFHFLQQFSSVVFFTRKFYKYPICFNNCILEPYDFTLFSAYKNIEQYQYYSYYCILETHNLLLCCLYKHEKYFIGYVLMFTVKLVHLLLTILSERKFCSGKSLTTKKF